MKVRLAAQTLSNSVAKSLEYCEKKHFGVNFDWTNDDLQPTIKYVQMFNDLFDTLNSRFFYTTDYAKPLSKATQEKD